MHDLDLILTLTGGLAAALICGYITFRLGLSPIVGYLLAGVVVGPHTPGFVADREMADQFAEIGVILLMFGVGLAIPPRGIAGGAASRRAGRPGPEPGRDGYSGRRSACPAAGAGRQASSSDWRSRSRARSCSCGCSPTAATCIRRRATSPSAGWSSKTCSPSSCSSVTRRLRPVGRGSRRPGRRDGRWPS